MHRGLEGAAQQVHHRVVVPVARDAGGAQRAVVRPDGAVVVGHRVVARFALGERAQSHPVWNSGVIIWLATLAARSALGKPQYSRCPGLLERTSHSLPSPSTAIP
jgi:hypothetical protein